ncbi:hypothetical protein BDD12DRAFT_894833 [Trichophaea hybrida]|nr:hypothetical protein BDD12DRAFT_894833 [Trichophaea hybrida]
MLHLPTPAPSPAASPISTTSQAILSQLAHVASVHRQQHTQLHLPVQKSPSSSHQTHGGLYLPKPSAPTHAARIPSAPIPTRTPTLSVTNPLQNFCPTTGSTIPQNSIPSQRLKKHPDSDLLKLCQPQPPNPKKSNANKRKRIIACLNCHKNKKKCSTGAVCTYCDRTGRRCVYPDTKPGRYQTGKNPTPKVQKRQENVRLYQEHLAKIREQELLGMQQHYPSTQPVYQQPVYQQLQSRQPVITSVHEVITIPDDSPPQSPAPIVQHTPPQSPESLMMPPPQTPDMNVGISSTLVCMPTPDTLDLDMSDFGDAQVCITTTDGLELDMPGISDAQPCAPTSDALSLDMTSISYAQMCTPAAEPSSPEQSTTIDTTPVDGSLVPLEPSKEKPTTRASSLGLTTPPAELFDLLPASEPLTPKSPEEEQQRDCATVDITFKSDGCTNSDTNIDIQSPEVELDASTNVDLSFGMSLIEEDDGMIDVETYLDSLAAAAYIQEADAAADPYDFCPEKKANSRLKWLDTVPKSNKDDDDDSHLPGYNPFAPFTTEELESIENWKRNLFGGICR